MKTQFAYKVQGLSVALGILGLAGCQSAGPAAEPTGTVTSADHASNADPNTELFNVTSGGGTYQVLALNQTSDLTRRTGYWLDCPSNTGINPLMIGAGFSANGVFPTVDITSTPLESALGSALYPDPLEQISDIWAIPCNASPASFFYIDPAAGATGADAVRKYYVDLGHVVAATGVHILHNIGCGELLSAMGLELSQASSLPASISTYTHDDIYDINCLAGTPPSQYVFGLSASPAAFQKVNRGSNIAAITLEVTDAPTAPITITQTANNCGAFLRLGPVAQSGSTASALLTGSVDSALPGTQCSVTYVAESAGQQSAPLTVTFDVSCDSCRPPRPIAPLSTATVTSQEPLFRWALAAGTDGAEVDICRDRACSTIVTTFIATGSSGAPTTPLAKGLYYWRLRPTQSGGLANENPSAVWEFSVGERSAQLNTSSGTTLDVNGDGFADVVVGALGEQSRTGSAYVYLGSAAGLSTAPVAIAGPGGTGGAFGTSVASAGDVNGDGFADVVIGAPGVNSGSGSIYLYLGGASGLSATPITIAGPDGGSFGYSVASAGDVNGDGFADVIVGASGVNNYSGRVYIYYGNATGIATIPATIDGTPSDSDFGGNQFAAAVAGAGDVNGDGFGDIVVGEPLTTTGSGTTTQNGAGCAYVYFGSATGPLPTAVTLLGTSGAYRGFGRQVASAGDVNGDGYVDVLVSDGGLNRSDGKGYLFLGRLHGIATTPVSIVAPGDNSAGTPANVASAGDVNGDGFADVVAASVDIKNGTGGATVYFGSASGLSKTNPASMVGPAGAYGYFGSSVASTGDVNGDGFADVLIGADGTSLGSGTATAYDVGSAYIYLGNASGISTSTPPTLTGPGGASGYFGCSVGGASE